MLYSVYTDDMCVVDVHGVAVGADAVCIVNKQIMCVLLTSAVKCDCKFWCCIVYIVEEPAHHTC